MKHKRFEEWIFADEILNSEEQKRLYDHLLACDDCYQLQKNWRETEKLLRIAPEMGPAPGFSSRWQAHLEDETRWTINRQSLGMLLWTSLSAGVFFWLFSLRLLVEFEGVIGTLAGKIFQFGDLARGFTSTVLASSQTTITWPPVLPILAGMGMFAFAGAAAILWLKMFRLFARSQGLTHWA